MDIFSFMARMLFFLPDKHRKMIRYYGIYTHSIDKEMEIDRSNWAKAVEHSFENNPEICPNCPAFMIKDVVFSYFADNEIKKVMKTHAIEKGYFIPYNKTKPP